jgi:uncharacterized protein (DUF1697 family)
MSQYVGFVRAVNVRGHPTLKMSDIKEAFTASGCTNVRTCIQSGNVIFETPQPPTATFESIRVNLHKLTGSEPTVLFRRLKDVRRIVEIDPFAPIDRDSHVKLYVAFLSGKPAKRPAFPIRSLNEGLEAIGMDKLDVFVVSRPKQNGFYGIPNIFVEKELGVVATSRNWSTIAKVARR